MILFCVYLYKVEKIYFSCYCNNLDKILLHHNLDPEKTGRRIDIKKDDETTIKYTEMKASEEIKHRQRKKI